MRDRVRLFGPSAKNFATELGELLAPDQTPAHLGGKCAEPWTRPEGGDVPRTCDSPATPSRRSSMGKSPSIWRELQPPSRGSEVVSLRSSSIDSNADDAAPGKGGSTPTRRRMMFSPGNRRHTLQ